MRSLYIFAVMAALGATIAASAASGTRYSLEYLRVRGSSQLAPSYTLEDIQTKPQKFHGLLLEVRGVITGIAESPARTTLLVDREDGAAALSVVLSPDVPIAKWPFLQAGTPVRMLCRVAMIEGSSNGELELRIAVPEGDAAVSIWQREDKSRQSSNLLQQRAQISRAYSSSPRAKQHPRVPVNLDIAAIVYVRSRKKFVVEKDVSRYQLQTYPDRFSGRLIEVVGAIVGTRDIGDRSSLLIYQGNGAKPVEVEYLPFSHREEWPFLRLGMQIHALCVITVFKVEAVNTQPIDPELPLLGVEADEDVKAALLRRRSWTGSQKEASQSEEKAVSSREPHISRMLFLAAEKQDVEAVQHAYSKSDLGDRFWAEFEQQRFKLLDEKLVEIYSMAIAKLVDSPTPVATRRGIAAAIIENSRRSGLDARLLLAVLANDGTLTPTRIPVTSAKLASRSKIKFVSSLNQGQVGAKIPIVSRQLRRHLDNARAAGSPELEALRLALACYRVDIAKSSRSVRKGQGDLRTAEFSVRTMRVYWQMLTPDERTWEPD